MKSIVTATLKISLIIAPFPIVAAQGVVIVMLPTAHASMILNREKI